jgi:hypothetical protein
MRHAFVFLVVAVVVAVAIVSACALTLARSDGCPSEPLPCESTALVRESAAT